MNQEIEDIINELESRGEDVSQYRNMASQQPRRRPSNLSWMVAEDLAEKFKEAPGELWEGIKGLGRGLADVPSTLRQEPTRLPRAAAAGMGELAGFIPKIPSNIAEYLGEKGFHPEAMQKFADTMRPPEADFRKLFGIEDERPSDVVGSLIGQGPAFAVGGAPVLASTVLGGKANPATLALGELLSPAAKGVAKGAKSAIEAPGKLAPSKLAARFGNISPEELQANLRATQGTQTPLGDVIKSPALKRAFENATSNVPFAGADEILSNVTKQIEDVGQKAFDNLSNLGRAGDIIDTNYLIKNELEGAFKKAETNKRSLYKEANNLAKKENINFEMENFRNLTNEIGERLADSPLLQSEPELSSGLRKIMRAEPVKTSKGKSNIVDEFGNQISTEKVTTSSLPELQVYASKLSQEAGRSRKSPNAIDRGNAKLYERAASAIRNDIRDTIESKGSTELKNAYKDANQNYAENFAPFLEGDIYKLIQSDKDAGTIANTIIKPSKRIDDASLIKKAQNLLPKDKQNLIGYTMLKKAVDENGNIDVKTLNKTLNSLGDRQFEALFPGKKTQQSLKDFQRLYKLNSEALNAMFNPKTGQRNSTYLTKAILAGAASGATFAGGPAGALTSLAQLGTAIGGSRIFNKLISSENFRNKVAEEILNNKSKYKSIDKIQIPREIQDVVAGIVAQSGGTDEPEDE